MEKKDLPMVARYLLAPAVLIILGAIALLLMPLKPMGSDYLVDPLSLVVRCSTLAGMAWMGAAGVLLALKLRKGRAEGRP